jgi:hypothetical protein
MENVFTRDDLRRMRELAAKGNLSEQREIDPTALPEELELVHLSDIVEMQELLVRAADELERLQGRAQG